MDLLADHNAPPFLWPIVTPALVPPIIVGFGFWTLLPAMRTAIPAGVAAGVAWGATLILCVAIWPMAQVRERVFEHEADLRAKWAADFANLASNAPLWEWAPFLNTRDDTRQEAVLQGIRKLDRRQTDAEVMLDRGDFPLLYLGRLDLDPTPGICEKARALLHRRAQPLVSQTPGARPYADVAEEVAAALAAMKWLVGYGCSCDAESLVWESMANGYRGTNFDAVELAELREPQALGRILLQTPDRFSMLTFKAHLRAWLKFADDKELRERALAGARTLDHRMADAVEMLNHDEYEAATVLSYMPALDLEAAEPLCLTSLKVLHDQFAPIYRPRPDDPRSYDELLSRLGSDSPLTALQWLASHGCDADGALTEAEELVRNYQDSPDRAAMLASLAQLHRKP
ncbi:MAG TPA: hypothetical protein VKI44_41295 [Acetobacteraceae bacterium]|nr:hypothetical protein [Acetobacteraceae bacterium]